MPGNLQRWENDPLFSAAEVVQDSSDRLESVFRTLLHEQGLVGAEPSDPKLLNSIEFHRRDLVTALGTTKWQLEDFERAVAISGQYDHLKLKRDTMSRHAQFIQATREQITRTEKTLLQPSLAEGNGNSQWLNLNEQDRNQLALFLTGGDSSDSISYDTDRSHLITSGDDPAPSGCDDGSDEIIELKIDESPTHEVIIDHDTNSLRHAGYGIQSKSAPHLSHFDHNHFASPKMNYNGQERCHWHKNGFYQGTIESRNHGAHVNSRAWEQEQNYDSVDNDDNSSNEKLKSCQARVGLWSLVSYLGSTMRSTVSQGSLKRKKESEKCDGYLVDVGQKTSSSTSSISYNEQIRCTWIGLISSVSSRQALCLGSTDGVSPSIWVGSLRRKFHRMHHLVRYKQFPLRTSMMFVTLLILGLIVFVAV